MELKATMVHLGRKLLTGATEGILISEGGGAIVFANDAASRIFGYDESEWDGLTINDLVPQNHRAHHSQHQANYLEKAVQKPMGIGRDLQALRKDGTIFPVEISLTPLDWEESEKPLIATMITDISQRKKLEEKVIRLNRLLEQQVLDRTRELNRSTAMYRTVARNYPNGTISVLDENLCYEFVEGKELFQLKITSEELYGSAYLDRLPEDVRGLIEARLQKALNGEDQQFEIEHHGQTYRIDALQVTVEGDGKRNILIVEQNITQIVDALKKERQLHELKSRFVSMASHEFRTPLSTIRSSAELAAKYLELNKADRIEKHLEKIGQGVTHLVAILDDYLSLEKFEEGSWLDDLEEVNVVAEVEKVVLAQQQLAKNGDAITFHCPETQAVEPCNTAALRGIAANLISNAVKYSAPGAPVEVRLTRDDNNWTLEVEDNGIGIPLEDQAHVFTRFFRGDSASHIPGTGVGLDLVQRYVEGLGGNITFESEPGQGSIFRAHWPIQSNQKHHK